MGMNLAPNFDELVLQLFSSQLQVRFTFTDGWTDTHSSLSPSRWIRHIAD
jgi:hypothetical protein